MGSLFSADMFEHFELQPLIGKTITMDLHGPWKETISVAQASPATSRRSGLAGLAVAAAACLGETSVESFGESRRCVLENDVTNMVGV